MLPSTENNQTPLIVGIGNEMRGDDAIGIIVVHRLSSIFSYKAEFLAIQDDLSNLLNVWKDRKVLVIDAIYTSDLSTGDLYVCESFEKISGISGKPFSTHGLDLFAIFELGRQLDTLPSSFQFFGIAGSDFSVGEKPGPAVIKGSERLIKMISKIIDATENAC